MKRLARPALTSLSVLLLVAFAVLPTAPGCDGGADDRKWSIAQALASTLQYEVNVHVTQNNGPGDLPTGEPLNFDTYGSVLNMDAEELSESDFFDASDVTLTFEADGSGADISYTITVNGRGHGNENASAPYGRLVWERGSEARIEN